MSELENTLRDAIRLLVRDEVRAALAAARPSPAEYLTTGEAAELARVTMGTVRRWVRRGDLPAVTVGRELRVERAHVDRLIRNGRRRASAPTDREIDAMAARDFG